jgi:hypothetical protein
MIEQIESLSVIAVDGGMCAAPVQRVVVHVFGRRQLPTPDTGEQPGALDINPGALSQ